MRRAVIFLAVVCLALLCGPSSAQTVAQSSTPAPSPASFTPAKYRFALSVVDDKGNTAEDLADQDVEVRIGRERATVLAARRYHEAPIRMVIVLDESGSMRQVWPNAIFIVVELLKSLPKNSAVGILGAGDKPGELLTSPDAIINYLNNRSQKGKGPEGLTRLWDHIHEALTALKNPRPSDVIFVVSDGGDNRSSLTQPKLRKELQQAGVRLSGAILTEPHPNTPEEILGTAALNELMQATGGRDLLGPPFFGDRSFGPLFLTGPRAQPKKYSEPMLNFFRTLYDFYLVEVTTPQPLTKPAKLEVRVKDASGNKRKRTVIAVPAELVPGRAG